MNVAPKLGRQAVRGWGAVAVREDAIPLFETSIAKKPYHGRLMMFGRPTLLWDDSGNPEEYFRRLGFDEVHSMDISPYDGATYIHDLNDPNPPAELVGQYDFVIASGTTEHVFLWHNAIAVAFKLLKVGGTLLFGSPMNNWVDHGFYQFSPTLKFDYFAANEWEFGVSQASFYWPDTGRRRVSPLYPGESAAINYVQARASHAFEAVKTESSTIHRVPKQSVYAKLHDGENIALRIKPSETIETVDGSVVPLVTTDFHLAKFQPHDGAFRAPFWQRQHLPSVPRRPFRSTALVYEDGELAPWLVSGPDMVAQRSGSFAHFGRFIYLSTSDGTDPRSNGRRYEVRFPEELRGDTHRSPSWLERLKMAMGRRPTGHRP